MNVFNPVSKIMTTNLLTLPSNASIAEASEIFKNNRIHHIPVVDDEKLVGIISLNDYYFFRRGFLDNQEDEKLEEIRMNNYEVSLIMTKGIGKLEPDDKIVVALDIFRKNRFHAIPVVSEGKLVGIVTTHDIIENIAMENKVTAEYE